MTAFIDKLAAAQGKGRTAEALARVASNLGVEQDALGAFIEVEAAGSGFDNKGRLKILFEKHHFWKHIDPARRAAAVAAGLARKDWVSPAKGGYGDQKTSDAKWDLLKRASLFDETAALKSASVGCGQIMGAHAAWLGYGTPQDFWDVCALDEDAQIEAMGRYIEKAGLVDEMRAKDWRGLAKGYNGPGQVDVYAPRLKAAYNKLKKIPDAPRPLAPLPLPDELTATEPLGPVGPLSRGDDGDEVREVQRALKAKGYDVAVDGDFGPGTERAVRNFQRKSGLAADGVVGKNTRRALGLPQ